MYEICRHLMVSGRCCTQPAVNESLYCRHHQVVKTTLAMASQPVAYEAPPQLPFVFAEDRAAIQLNLMMVLKALNDGKIDSRTANSMNRLLNTCLRNLAAGPLTDPQAKDVVRNVIKTPDGEEIAPPREAPEESEQLEDGQQISSQLEDGQLKSGQQRSAQLKGSLTSEDPPDAELNPEGGPLTADDETLLADLFPEAIARYKAAYAARVQTAIDAGLEPPAYEPWHLGKFVSNGDKHDAAQQGGAKRNGAQHEGAERDQEDGDRIEHDRQAAHEDWMRLHPNKSLSWNEQEDVRVAGLRAGQ